MTDPALIERITRSLAYMLRHQPHEFDLELDAHGYADVEDVVRALNERLGEPIEREDVDNAIRAGDRPRYELVGERLRALYGHSIPVEPGEPATPPELLYVGLGARDADRALQHGLSGGRRRFLHLARSVEDARESGRRAGREYAVLVVRATEAWEEGVNFYDRQALFLSEAIPTRFIGLHARFQDGEDRQDERGFAPRAREDEPRTGRPFADRDDEHAERGERRGRRRRRGRGGDRERERRPVHAAHAEAGEQRDERRALPRDDEPRREPRGERRDERREPAHDERRHDRGGFAQRDEPRRERHGPRDRGREGRPHDRPRDDRGRPRSPERPPSAAPARPAPQPPAPVRAADERDFGLGVFPEAARAPEPPRPREERRPPPPPPPPPPRVERAADTDDGFGAGV